MSSDPQSPGAAPTQVACVALGSNLGRRQALLDAAIAAMDALPGTRVEREATRLESAPVDCPPEAGPFINSVVRLETALTPRELMLALLEIERRLGRERDGTANAPRTIDLDLLLHGDAVISDDRLTLPHPRMHLRDFVLEPLSELAPEWRHPVLGRTVRELLAALPTGSTPGA